MVVQIVDARNPLLFRCEDLVSFNLPHLVGLTLTLVLFSQEKYVKEINSEKVNVLLISKADLLATRQR